MTKRKKRGKGTFRLQCIVYFNDFSHSFLHVPHHVSLSSNCSQVTSTQNSIACDYGSQCIHDATSFKGSQAINGKQL